MDVVDVAPNNPPGTGEALAELEVAPNKPPDDTPPVADPVVRLPNSPPRGLLEAGRGEDLERADLEADFSGVFWISVLVRGALAGASLAGANRPREELDVATPNNPTDEDGAL